MKQDVDSVLSSLGLVIWIDRSMNAGASVFILKLFEVVIESGHTSWLEDLQQIENKILRCLSFPQSKDGFDNTTEFLDDLVNVLRLVGVIALESDS